jgi:hypothetical protein
MVVKHSRGALVFNTRKCFPTTTPSYSSFFMIPQKPAKQAGISSTPFYVVANEGGETMPSGRDNEFYPSKSTLS